MLVLTPERMKIVGHIAMIAKIKSEMAEFCTQELMDNRRDLEEPNLWDQATLYKALVDQLNTYLRTISKTDLNFIDALVDIGAEGVQDGEVMLKDMLKDEGNLALGIAQISALHIYLEKGVEKLSTH